MERDPHSLTDDLATFDSVIAALDPQHCWKLDQASGNATDSGYGNIALTLTGAPAFQQATGITGVTGVQFASGSFFTPASALPASTTTFTILALVKLLHDNIDTTGAVLWSHTSATGLAISITGSLIRAPLFTTDSGSDWDDDYESLGVRQVALVTVVVTDGVAKFYRNGVRYEGGDGNVSASIATFTPTRVGAVDASNLRLRAVLARLVYMPGVALTDAQIQTIWAARFSCHDATLALVNHALAHVGQSQFLTSLSSGSGPAYETARRFIPSAVESILRDFNWPAFSRLTSPTLVGGTAATAFNSDWQFRYRAPEDFVRAIRIKAEGDTREFNPAPSPFRTAQDAVGWAIDTDVETAELEYIIRPTCPALQGDVNFREALAWYLAALFVPTLSKNEKTQADCYAMAAFYAAKAHATAANEEESQDTRSNDPDWIRNR
jgi:hypothetical protein